MYQGRKLHSLTESQSQTLVFNSEQWRQSLQRTPRASSRPTQSHQGPRRSKSRSVLSPTLAPASVSAELKTQIHTWLVDLQVVPASLYLHEFLYRVRTGISLSDLINRLEGRAEVVHGVHQHPKNASYCLANINKTLEYLRKIPKVKSRFLWSANEIYEGSEDHIYGLLSDIREFYMHRYPNFLPRSRSSSASRSMRKSQAIPPFDPIAVTGAMKRNVIQWVNSLGLDRFVTFHKNPLKDNLINGVLLCEVVGELLQSQLPYVLKPLSDCDCAENYNLSLKAIRKHYPVSRFPVCVDSASEDVAWSVLWELMHQTRTYADSYDSVGMKVLEQSLLSWLDSLSLLPPRVTTLLELVPNFRNGVLLCALVCKLFPSRRLEANPAPQTAHAALQNVRRALAVLKQEPSMSQSFTWKERELQLGDLKVLYGLLEDLHRCADGLAGGKTDSPRPYLGSGNLSSTIGATQVEVPPNRNQEKVRELEEWLDGIGVAHRGLTKETLAEFRTGEKICEIVQKLERKEFEGVHKNAKTAAASLANIRKALEFLYKKPAFPSKFMYYDDQILAGNGKVLRSLLFEIKRVYKNRLVW
jgi:hypothetical protein